MPINIVASVGAYKVPILSLLICRKVMLSKNLLSVMMRFRKINIADVDMKLSLHFKDILTAWKPSFVILMKSDLTFIETIRLDLW